MDPFRTAPKSCHLCPELSKGACKRCGGALCLDHRHKKHRRCESCEAEYRTSLVKLEAKPSVVRSRNWRNIPLDIAVLALFALALPALVVIDLVILAFCLGFFGELWPLFTVRAGYPWLRGKERRLWSRRQRQMRRRFLKESPQRLEGAPTGGLLGPGQGGASGSSSAPP